jgi:hypothetical protein
MQINIIVSLMLNKNKDTTQQGIKIKLKDKFKKKTHQLDDC